MTKIQIIVSTLLISAIVFVGIAILVNKGVLNMGGIGGPDIGFNRFTTASSSYMTLVANTANQILATTTSRAYARIYNESNSTVYLNINQGGRASSTVGIVLEANDIYEFVPGKNLYDGMVYASSTAAAVLHILEVTTDD